MRHSLVQRLGSSWYVWIFPAFAVLLCAGLFYQHFAEQGPRIEIELGDASGVQPDKTTLRYHGVSVGTVEELRLNPDEVAEVEVRLTKQGARFATEGARFALMKPKASFEGITGLETVIEGLYIQALPGREGAKKASHFKAEKNPLDREEETVSYQIEADDSESISTGDAITYRGVKIGTVGTKAFNKEGSKVVIRINIEPPRTFLIRENTVFWRKVGVQGQFGLFGAKIQMNSFESIVNGGIQLATPDPAGAKAKSMHLFGLQKVAPKDYDKWAPKL